MYIIRCTDCGLALGTSSVNREDHGHMCEACSDAAHVNRLQRQMTQLAKRDELMTKLGLTEAELAVLLRPAFIKE